LNLEAISHRVSYGEVLNGRSIERGGGKGYLSQPLAQYLLVTQGLHLITKLRKWMCNRLLEMSDKCFVHVLYTFGP
jgi:Transposase DDE domain